MRWIIGKLKKIIEWNWMEWDGENEWYKQRVIQIKSSKHWCNRLKHITI